MNKETRIQKIEEIKNLEPIGEQEIMWEDQLQPMKVYKIPLKYLVYNKYNGRILSRTKSLEARGIDIDSESEEGKKRIEELLLKTNEGRNRRTQVDIEKYGQKQVGIITKDGIIIDGNRRAMLLNGIEKYDYFKAIILPVKLEDNPIEIQKLETSYQMGEDEKLTYNATEKYLKSKDLVAQGIQISKIANWMGETEATINEYLQVMEIMDEYLNFLGYGESYTQLDKREDLFISLNKWIRTFQNVDSSKAFDGYKISDVDDLKVISFDYIRARYEGKEFRVIAQGLKESHLFGDKKIWENFRDAHFCTIDPIRDSEESVNFDSPDMESTLNARDEAFSDNVKEFLGNNIKEHEQYIYNKSHKNEPAKLVSKSIEAINVARSNENIESPDVLKKVEELNEITNEILKQNSPTGLLKSIFNLLSGVSLKTGVSAEEKDQAVSLLKDISSQAYKLEKDIKTNK